MDDRLIIQGIIRNKEHSFRQLIEKYKNLVYATSFRVLGNASDAEDICQEVFLEVFKSIHKLKSENDLSGWLFKIAKNKSISFLRKRNPAKAQNASDIHDEQIASKLNIDYQTPAKKLEEEEIRCKLLQAIDTLPERQKRVLLMHKFENFSQKEICKKLNLSEGSVESLMSRANANLRKLLYSYFKNHLN